jgi:hypothetical protein
MALAIVLALAPATASAQEHKPLAESLSGDAKGEYAAGMTLFADGDHARALLKFQSAYDASKDARLFWNIGACNKALRHYADAIRNLERFKTEGGAALSDKDRADADELIAALRPYVAALSVQANEADASVVVDERPIGQTPLKKFLVDLGQHRVVVKKAGFGDETRALDVTGNAEVMLEVQLKAVAHVGRIAVHAGAADSIDIDGRTVAVGNYDGVVASGEHVVRVSAPKKTPYETHVTIEDGQTRTLQVALEAPTTTPWLWIGAGAAATATAVIVTILLLKSGDDATTGPVSGTMPPGYVNLRGFSFR